MLEIKKISKLYETAGFKQKALDEVSIKFRENEFVSILGPSGSGKTTLLNIIGGLDKYTSGDLIINGTSTKNYTDSDWDTYRNHSIGFVFQTYNLIPHQTVLKNVELALTLSGITKEVRKKRAIEVLKKVGLGDHINKRPNQLSGGQMQRVAIARALINNPDILLADEPTGALDSETSVQIMNILKNIAKEKSVIMVTHNADLAEEYSTRIVKLLDGHITSDTNPFDGKQEKSSKDIKTKKSMSFKTALSLSLNNLMTKKGRTILTALAGSIGIIGIALILSLSNGVQEYINKVEEDTSSSYPISIESSTMDMGSMMTSFAGANKNKVNHDLTKIYSNDIMGDMINLLSSQIETNNLQEFKKYVETNSEIQSNKNAIQYSYNLDLQIYKSDTSDGITQVQPNKVFESLGLEGMNGDGSMNGMGGMSMFSMGGMSNTNVWSELLNNKSLLQSQYDVVAGTWPSAYNEIVLMVNSENEITDYALYSLGLKNQDDLKDTMKDMISGKPFEVESTSYTYEELLELKFKLILNTDYYEKKNGVWNDKSDNEAYMKKIIENAPDIKIVGIVKPNKEAIVNSNNTGVGYTSDLTKYVIEKINESKIAQEQIASLDTNIFTGLKFSTDNKPFDMSSLTNEQKAYLASLSQAELAKVVASYTENASATYEDNLEKLGIVDIDNPSKITIYPKDFESKEKITNAIDTYNNDMKNSGKDELTIKYTDIVGLLMKSVTNIINTISYVLIAFVAISLIVSSIMIGIITYISVLERTKEIGILRAIGASKKDISRVFNAETIIEGFGAGVMGIAVTFLLTIPINMIIKHITGISNIALLPLDGAIILIFISTLLTVIAGLIPSKMAAKKDPVEALRTE